jgi:hypothetical protein
MKLAITGAVAAIALESLAGSATAQPPASVDVQLGPAVQRLADSLGSSELDGQREYLRKDVLAAVSRSRTPPAAVHLVIADIQSNRPTSAQLGQSTGLRQTSFGTGGAAITGEVVTADGRRLPVRYRFFQDQLRDEVNFTTWGDADQAFDDLSAAIGAGRVPNDPSVWPPPHQPRAVTGTRIP